MTAVSWVEANEAEHCIDASRFGVIGESAGAFIGLIHAYGLDDFSLSAPTPDVLVDLWGAALVLSQERTEQKA